MSMIYSDKKLSPFVFLFEGRSGSTYLIESLDSHPDICAEKEYLSVLRERMDSSNIQLQWVREFLNPPPEADCIAIGFKTKLKDVLDPEGLAKLMREMHVKIIHLQRRNRIKRLVSVFNSMRLKDITGDWNLYDEKDRLRPVTIDIPLFKQWLEWSENENLKLGSYVKNLELPTLSLYYEDLLVDERVFIERICSFLGVQFKPVLSGCKKNTIDDLRKALLNFDELRSHYLGTPYEQMFDEVLEDDPADPIE